MGATAYRDRKVVRRSLDSLLVRNLQGGTERLTLDSNIRFNQLQEIDVEDVPACARANFSDSSAARKDEPADYKNRQVSSPLSFYNWQADLIEFLDQKQICREALWKSAPDKEGAFVKVPKIL